GSRIAGMIERAGVTYLWATATTWQLLVDAGWPGKQDLVAMNGGEPISADLADAIWKLSSQLWNTYGPTETTVTSTLDRFEGGHPITIGRPIANTKVYVLDPFGQPVPLGVSGELYISGAGVADGYVNRPEETAARFSDDPFNRGARMYRTGDLVHQLADGRLQHLRRLDDQIKLRGYRIELGEVESALRAYPGVASAAVALVDEPSPRGSRLVAYVVPSVAMPQPSDLRRHLRSSLPEYMVPSAFVELDELPRSPNGKLDRRRLPAPGLASGTGVVDVPDTSRTPLEDQLLDIWSETLGVERLGVDDDFFELGGHSLLAVRLVVEAGKHLEMEVPLSFLYEHGATVRSMALAIEEARESESTSRTGVGKPASSVSKLFFVVPWEPTLVALRHLRPALAPEHTVVGLLAGRHGQPFDRATGIEERAVSLLESIIRIQDRGPYLIAGSSFGGLVAYEIATLLQEDGQEVAWLGLVNTYAPAKAARPSSVPVKVARALVRPRASVAALGERVAPGNRVDVGEGFDGRGAFALGLAYEPRPNGLPLDLFVSERDAIAHGRTLGWNRSHSGPLRVHIMPGDHLVFFDSRNAPTLARKIRQSLDELR
ncbi:MAG TPA: AMP-binding protein, partial [Acidimicrobiales bacterium]|nr:AMP-binding protein [Acidimicrobiales bacterium]